MNRRQAIMITFSSLLGTTVACQHSTKIDLLPGSENLGEIDDCTYFMGKMISQQQAFKTLGA